MGNSNERSVIIRVGAKDDASAALNRIASNAKKSFRDMEQAPKVFGPARSNRFDGATQFQRDHDAGQLRALRTGADREIVEATRRSALLGTGDLEKNGFAGKEFMEGAKPGGESGKSRFGGAQENWYKKIKESTEELEKMSKVVRGVGAVGALVEIANKVGEALQELPKVTHEYAEAMKRGEKASEFWAEKAAANIPGAGSLARGLRAYVDGGDAERFRAKDEYEQQQNERSEIQKKAAEREKGRAERMRSLLEGADQADTTANANSRLFMTRGTEKSRIEAQLAFEEKARQIGHETLTGNDLTHDERQRVGERTPEERARLEQSAASRIAQARRELAQELYDIDRESNQKQMEQEQAQRDRIIQIKSSGTQRDLQLLGYEASARMTLIRESNEKEITELGRRHAEETRDMKDMSPERMDAEKRYREELAALKDKGGADVAAEAERTRRENATSDRKSDRDLEGTRAETIANRLRAAGLGQDAEKIQRAEAHRQRIKDIDEQVEEAKRTRGEWYMAGGSEEFRQKRIAENESYKASEAVDGIDTLRRNLPSFSTNLTSGFGLSGAVSAGAMDAANNLQARQEKALTEISKLSKETLEVNKQLLATLKSGGVQLVVLKAS